MIWLKGGRGLRPPALASLVLLATLAFRAADALANTNSVNFVNFETAPVHPLALGPDQHTLAVCNLPDNRVELFDVATGVPAPLGSVAVGLDPVTARFASANELWVANYISSTISIIDVAAQAVVATLETPAGPSDIVFAGNPRRAWVTCARTNSLFVINPLTRTAITNLLIEGERPRALATSPDRQKVYVAIFESGNGTTVIGARLTPVIVLPDPGPVDDPSGPYGGINPPPNSGTNFSPAIVLTNPPPLISHLVRKNAAGRWMDDNQADWTEWVSGTKAASSGRIPGWDLPDRDLAIIDTATLNIQYAHHLMNICMALGVNPVSGEVAVIGTDAINERRFEPVLNGLFLRVNLALVDPVTRTNRIRDLNPHLDYVTRTLTEEQRALGLGDPRGIEWSADGSRAYITGMGSRNLIIVDANGQRLNPHPIELGEGPTGLALDEIRGRLYVWNRFSSSLSVVDTSAGVVLTNLPVFDPTPDVIRRGRRHLYDARETSGSGIISCASCHVDGRGDRLAWDLGDPAGHLVTNANFVFHPMKGPMVTQTLQDIITPPEFNGEPLLQQPLHWRGDRKNIEDFNHTFTALQAAESELTTNEMADFKGMLASIYFPPNFLRTFSNTLPATLNLPGHFGAVPTNGGPRPPLPPGIPRLGQRRFERTDCTVCHGFDQGGDIVGGQLASVQRAGTQGAFKASQLRSLLDKVGLDGFSTNSRAGFGYMHDGRIDTLSRFLLDGFPALATNDQAVADLVSFLFCFVGSDLSDNPSGPSQDVPAAAGKQLTLLSPIPSARLNDMYNLALLPEGRLELLVRGRKEGRMRQWLLQPATQNFQSDRHGEWATSLAELIAPASPANPFTAMLVPRGSGVRLALDRDGDGYYDSSEVELGYDPSDPSSHPGRIVGLARVGSDVVISFESAPGTRYAVEGAAELKTSTVWQTLGSPILATELISTFTDSPPPNAPFRFYRVRREP